jgi:hypothetical protein
MVQVKYGAIITDMKGKIGGQTFKGNYTAASCQNIVKPFQRSTDFNQLWKPNVGYLSASWRALTNAQRVDWNTLATTWPFYNCFNVLYHGTGFQVFMSVNLSLASVGLGMHTIAANRVLDFAFANVSGVWSNILANCTLTFDNITALGNWYVSIKASYLLSVGQFGTSRKLALIGVIPNNNPTINYPWGSIWNAHYSRPVQNVTSFKLMLQLKAIHSISGQNVKYNALFLNSPI